MKTCPICGAVAFDDAGTCFGCLHRFEAGGGDVPAPAPASSEVRDEPKAHIPGCALPSFLITIAPPDGGAKKDWTCSVQLVSA